MIWLLTALTVYRLTRLVTTDVLTAPIREWVQARYDRLGYLVGCDWCSSMWIAPAPVILAACWPASTAVVVALGIPAMSAVAGITAQIVDRITPQEIA